jgi:hypothetical protein
MHCHCMLHVALDAASPDSPHLVLTVLTLRPAGCALRRAIHCTLTVLCSCGFHRSTHWSWLDSLRHGCATSLTYLVTSRPASSWGKTVFWRSPLCITRPYFPAFLPSEVDQSTCGGNNPCCTLSPVRECCVMTLELVHLEITTQCAA